MTFPPDCTSPLDRLAFVLRVHWLLIAAHNAKRAETITRKVEQTSELFLNNTLSPNHGRSLGMHTEIVDDPEQVAAFKRWQQEWLRPRDKRCNELIRQYRAGFDAETYQRIREEQRTDTRWDNAIDLEWMPLLGTEHERPDRDLDAID